ncbi:MAG TPA: oligosaccharide flippase family protein [Pyrinomonadaceae bacterium]
MHDRKGRLILNSAFSLLSWLAPVVLGLLVTPIIISRLGNESYGVYLVLIGFISYSFAFNVGRTVAKYVAEFRATDECWKVKEAISSAFWLNLGIGLFGAAVIALMARWLVSDVLQISPELRKVAESALILGGFSIPATLIAQVFQNVLQGLHRFGKISLVSNVNWLLLNAGNVVLVVNGYGVAALFGWNLATAITTAIVSFILVRHFDETYVPGVSISRRMFSSIASYGLGIFLYQLFGVILVLFERGWLIRNFGAAESAFYLLPMTLALYMNGLIGSLSLAAFPVVNELLADRARLVALYQKATKVMFAVTALSVATAICCGRLFLMLWVGDDYAANAYTNLIFHFLTFGVIALMIIIWQINEAHHAVRINAIQTFIWGAVAIPLMVVTARIWLAEGVAASRLIGVLVTIPMLFYCERRFLGGVFWGFWTALVVKVSSAVLALAVVERSMLAWLEPSWLSLVFAAATGTAAFALVALMTGLVTADEKEILFRLVRRRPVTAGQE